MTTSPYSMTTITDYERAKCGIRLDGRQAYTSADLPAVLAIIVVLLIFLLPAVSALRESARQAQCSENLKQITRALHAYHQQHGSYPPAYIADEKGKPMHSWRTLILPYLAGGQTIHDEYRFDEPWNSPYNLEVAQQMPPALACPSCGEQQFGSQAGNPAATNYVAVTGANSVFPGTDTTKHDGMKRGTSRTILVVDIAAGTVPWTAPLDITADDFVAIVRQEAGRNHPHGTMVACADASTRLIAPHVSPEILKALIACSPGD